MVKFPSIEQFRNVVKQVRLIHDYQGKEEDGTPIYKHLTPYPTLTFCGTVKIHGTNAAIVKYKDRVEYQSRERVLSLQQDNSGFMLAMMRNDLDDLFDRQGWRFENFVAVFGEWCGQGIQSGVAVSQVPKMFVIFAINIDGQWLEVDKIEKSTIILDNVYTIDQFPTYKLSIDFNNPELAQNKLIEITEQVEKQCPVGKHFGVDGIGEGVVWKAKWNDYFLQFKVKGEKHSVSKVKTLAAVDVEMVNSINEFVDNVVTENRLQQGIVFLKENDKAMDQKSTGDFLRWVVNDVIKEETDTIVSSQLDPKKINPVISKKARVWYFNYLDNILST